MQNGKSVREKTFALLAATAIAVVVIAGFAVKSGGYVEVNVRPGWIQVKIDKRVDYLLNVPTAKELPRSNLPSVQD